MKKLLMLSCIYFLAVAPSFAKSTLHLKSGEKVEGDIIERTDDYVKVNLEGVDLTYWSDQIENIEMEKNEDTSSQVAVDVSPQAVSGKEALDVSAVETVVKVVPSENPNEAIKEKALVVDGLDKDWAGSVFVFDEVGEVLPDSAGRFDVQKLYLAVDNNKLYFLITLNQDIADYFTNSENASSYIAEIYLNTDNNTSTGCAKVKLFGYEEISGYDCEIEVLAGTKASSAGKKPFVSYGILFPTEQRNSFYLEDAGYKSASLDKDAFIGFSAKTIEFSIPLNVLNLRKGDEVGGLIVECAKMACNRFIFMVKEGQGVSPLDAVKILMTEKLEKQEHSLSSQEVLGGPTADSLKTSAIDYEEKPEAKKSFITRADIFSALKYAFFTYVFFALCLQVIAIKTGTASAWHAWIPILNLILMCRIASKPLWWAFLLFVPLVNIVFFVFLWMGIAEARNKPSWLGWFMFIPGLNFIILMYLTLSL